MLTFKQYLTELTSINDNNAIGGLIKRAQSNLKSLSQKQKTTSDLCNKLISILSSIDNDNSILYTDEFSTVHYLEQLTNPKIDINSLRLIHDAFQSFSSDGE